MTQNLILLDKQKALYGTLKAENEEEKKGPSADLLQATIGDYGFWQYKIAILMSLLRLPVNWFELGIVFLAPPTQFWCNFPPHEGNSTDDEFYSNLTLEGNACHINIGNDSSMECRWGYSYNRTVIHSSIITEWDLVCERESLVDLVQVVIMIGVLFGSVFFGFASDKFGRKKILLFTITLQFVASIMSTYTPWFFAFLFIKFLSGFADGGINVTSFVMCMEVLGGTRRTIISMLYHIPLGLGNILMAAIAYFLRDWRQLSFAFSIISGIFMIYVCLLPESPRWLLSVGKQSKAIKVLEAAAKANGINRNIFIKTVEEFNLSQEAPKVEEAKFFTLIQTSELLKRSLLLWINWFVLGIVFYGFNEYTGVVTSNIYLAEVVIGIASIPGYVLSAYVAIYFKRRTVIALFSFFTAACYVLLIIIQNKIIGDVLISFIYLGISVTTAMLPLFTGELYPTVLRNAGIGSAAMCKKFGAVLAPLVIELGKVGWFLPLLVFAVSSILLGLLIIPLPETSNKNLPDTISDIED